jgi:hypothetical protein
MDNIKNALAQVHINAIYVVATQYEEATFDTVEKQVELYLKSLSSQNNNPMLRKHMLQDKYVKAYLAYTRKVLVSHNLVEFRKR